MKYTQKQREDAAIKACAEWLKTKWGEHYGEMVRYLPAEDAEEVRLMLQRSIRQAMSRRPNELVTKEEVNRQYCNLLDSHKLDIYEKRMEMFKGAALAAEELATEARRERAEVAAVIAQADEAAAFEQSIADRQAEDKANREVSIKELRRRALFGNDRVKGHLKTTPMPASVKHIYREPAE